MAPQVETGNKQRGDHSWFHHTASKVVLLFLVFFLVEEFILVLHIQRLRASFRSQTIVPVLKVGDAIPSLNGVDLQGKTFTSTPMENGFIFIFSPDCPYCGRSVESWRFIEGKVGPDKVIWASVGDRLRTAEFLRKHNVTDPVLVLSPESTSALKALRVPQTIGMRERRIDHIVSLSLAVLISLHLRAFAADNPNDPCYKTYQLDMLQCNQYDCKVNPQLADCQTLYQYCTSEARSRYDLCKGSGGGGNPGLGCATLAGYECISCCEQAYPCVFEGGGPECGYNSCASHCGV